RPNRDRPSAILVLVLIQDKYKVKVKKQYRPAKGEGIGAFFSIHQVNLYDCSVKKVKIAVLRGPDSRV
ncbi:hypothetical protein, partial [Klebsiella pneumoniae]|uniref:hypothetical protein n=1 Tax=Klebsiella pneumoniae TaxID=573 RepID=UPI00098336C5